MTRNYLCHRFAKYAFEKLKIQEMYDEFERKVEEDTYIK